MNREIVRRDRAMSEEDAIALLKSQDYGVLCVNGEDGYPYGVPINYAYADGLIYIHGTNGTSHKLDCLRRDERVCLTVVGDHEIIPEVFSTKYSSCIVFGRARILETDEEKQRAMLTMVGGLTPEMLERAKEHCVRNSDGYSMIAITPEQITGKQRKG